MKIKSIDDLFYLDNIRTNLCIQGNLKKLTKTYKIEHHLKNINTSGFWSEHLENIYCTSDPMRDDRIRNVCHMIKKNARDLLNIGVGDGRLEVKLNKTHNKVDLVGIDITCSGLKTAKQRADFFGIIGSITSLPVKKKFDVITVLEVLEHLLYTETFSAFKEIKKALHKSGELIISVPVNEIYTSENNPNGHLRRYSLPLILSELRIAGFKPVQLKTLYAFNKMYTFKSTILTKVFPLRWKPNVVIIKSVQNNS